MAPSMHLPAHLLAAEHTAGSTGELGGGGGGKEQHRDCLGVGKGMERQQQWQKSLEEQLQVPLESLEQTEWWMGGEILHHILWESLALKQVNYSLVLKHIFSIIKSPRLTKYDDCLGKVFYL